ncbi:MAG: type II secretion system F family protein [Candidatus Krumholzibacteriia bacterium]
MPIAVRPEPSPPASRQHVPVPGSAGSTAAVASTTRPAPARSSSAGRRCRRVGDRTLLFFATRLALLLETGSSLNRALAAIAKQIEDAEMKRITSQLRSDVEDGMPLSAALERHPQVFDNVFASMARAGESTGTLHPMLQRQVELLRRRMQFRAALRSTLSYPVFLTGLCFVVVVFMLVVIFPRFGAILSDLHGELPWMTRALMALSAALRGHPWPILLATVGGVLALRWALQTPRGRERTQRLQFCVPVLGGFLRQLYAGRLLLNLGTLLASRVPLLDAVLITEGLLPRAPYARFFAALRSSIEGGRGVAPAFAESKLFPPTVEEMVQTGESSASLDRVMLRLAEFYEDEVQERLRLLLQVLEPILLVTMGVVVAGISLSLILPIFKLSRGIH